MLAIEYALAYPEHLSGLVISNMTASIPSYVKHVDQLRAALPPDIRRAMQGFEDRGDYLAPEYQQLLFEHLYSKHMCRLDPWPEPAMRAFTNLNAQVYNTMQGPVITSYSIHYTKLYDQVRERAHRGLRPGVQAAHVLRVEMLE